MLSDGEATAMVWDFGGQEITHGTHQFFLTHRSLDHQSRCDTI
jgi:hypothetical protein